MGISSQKQIKMKAFALSALCCAGLSAAQLVAYPNGAVAPFDPNNAAATQDHFEALAEAGSIVNPYNTHAQNLLVAAPVYYGKRSADAQLVTYANGAVAPYDHNVAVATANHFAAKAAYGSVLPAAGVLGVHPAVYYGKRSADPQLVTYANGAVAPFDPNVAVATASHFAAKAAHGSWWPAAGAAGVHPAAPVVYGHKKRSADAQFLTYALPYAVAPYVPLVAHPNGAVVPAEPADVVEARADHLAAVAEASG